MLRILQFLYSIRAFLLFVFLEVVAVWLIVSNNSPQGAAFFNSSNEVVGSILKKQADVVQFFALAEANEALTEENSELLTEVLRLTSRPDSSRIMLDSAFEATFEFRAARVIGNSLRFSQNYLTLNKGAKDGIKPGMGVFDSRGVIGRVKTVSENYSVAFSLLNTSLLVSSKIKSNDVFGSVQWDGKDTEFAKLLYIPRHVKAQAGDTVISEVQPDEENSNYLDIKVKLSADFSKVTFVYLVENNQIAELDSLNKQAEITNEY